MKSLSLAVLKLPNFRLLLATRFCNTATVQAQGVIIGWQIYSLTKDPLMLGLTGLTEALPAILCALFAGHIVDSFSPQKIFRICIGVNLLNTLLLFLGAGGYITLLPHTQLMLMFGGVFMSGVVRSFFMPCSSVILSRTVVRKEMPTASAWLNSGFQTAAIASPAIAGVIFGGYGAHIAWCIPLLMVSLAFIMVNFMQTPEVARPEKREPAVASIRAGWAFIFQNPVLLSVMALDMFAVLFGGAVAMLPAYADQVLHIGAQGLGILRAAPAIGAVVVALFLALRPLQRISATRLLYVVTGFGCCMIGFGLSHYFWLSLFFLLISGGFDSVSVVIRTTIQQLLTADGMRGRVSSVNSMFIISSNEIGAFESGLAAKFLGLVPSVVIGGMCTLLVVVITATLSPKFRRTVVYADEAQKI